jgi:predicted HAD superfamily Cof-like phosphohydrolase
MSELRRQVTEFHEAFGAPIADHPSAAKDERMRLRARLISEEFFETMRAIFGGNHERINMAETTMNESIKHDALSVDMVDLADGLADLDYVVEGCRIECGIDGAPIAAEVHRSNMAKIGGSKRSDGKFLKPANWTPPAIARELERQGWIR